jgi:hypothetical protein
MPPRRTCSLKSCRSLAPPWPPRECPGWCPGSCPGSCPGWCPGRCPDLCPRWCPGWRPGWFCQLHKHLTSEATITVEGQVRHCANHQFSGCESLTEAVYFIPGRLISTPTARGGFGAAPGVPDTILGHNMAGAMVVDKYPAPPGPGILSTTTAPVMLLPRILSGTPGATPKPLGRWWWIYFRPIFLSFLIVLRSRGHRADGPAAAGESTKDGEAGENASVDAAAARAHNRSLPPGIPGIWGGSAGTGRPNKSGHPVSTRGALTLRFPPGWREEAVLSKSLPPGTQPATAPTDS